MRAPVLTPPSLFRISLSLTICGSLLVIPNRPLLISGAAAAQGQGQNSERTAPPTPGRPEGTLPDLDDVQNESQLEREAPPPIPSTIRSPRNPLKPWDGRRVGDPEAGERLDQTNRTVRGSAGSLAIAKAGRGTRRAHAAGRTTPPPSVLDDQFVQNFFTWAVVRNPTSSETTYWYDQMRVGYAQGPTSLKLAAIELGRTLFESAEYAARNRNDHWYVYDLYKTYLMRDPDASGWAFWESQVLANGRENVRRGFEESAEFAGIIGSIVPNGSATQNPTSLISARVDPRNQPGNGLLTRDASWSVPLLSLPGRAGLDLGLILSHSSMVWTRSGPYIYFDEDNGFPSPGFRLGFPTVQRKVFDAQTAGNAYLLLTAAGRRVELRQVGSTNIYDAYDSSYLRLTDNGATLLVHATDGTKMSFSEFNGEFRCVEIKDRNGNYITVNYNGLGRITTITDTLSRVITFNYDGNANLLSITQSWNGQPSHQWVSFGWGTRTMQSSFSGVAVVGTANNTNLPVITQVGLNDTSHFTFDYTNSLQLSVVRNYFGTQERNATTFNYDGATGDVPRLISTGVSAQNWTGVNGVPAQVVTQYSVAGDACVMTAPDGTIYKEFYGTGWQKGLTTLSEVWSGGVRQKWTETTWTQNNTSVSYEVNPRVTEINVHDGSNQRRTVIVYGSSYGLPQTVREYAADAQTVIRETQTDYNLNQAYLDRRIIGLVSEVRLTNGSQSQTKITYSYDEPARLQAVPAAATRHDTAYNTSFTTRGNVTAISRWDVTDINNAAKKLTTYTNYYTTGTPISTTDPAGHQSSTTYADSFSDNINRNTFAYPTTLTDAGGFSSYVQYNFDFGATTRTQSPTPAGQSQGTIQTMTYNSLGQLERITTTNNGAYKRFWYGSNFTASYATVNNVADELYSIAVVDGVGRVIGAASNHPGSTGGYRLVNTVYNSLGQVWKQSNPTEVNNSWVPSGDDAAGIYYTQQTYDWQGRPLITTNPNGTTKEASYAGCGCAGGTVVTLTDEGTIDNGVAKRRQQKIFSDVLGRTIKTEILNWQNGSVYSATVNTYNARDQVTQMREYAGPAGSTTYQDTNFTFDGYGRLKTKHVPEQDANANTTWDYNSDHTIQKITDGRGAATHYTYNSRHLVTGISYSVPSQSPIFVPAAVSFSYDAAANRSSMTDGTGSTTYSYDSLSRLTSESRTFTGDSTSYALNYSYNLANALTALAIPFKSQQIGYNYDTAGRLSGVTASGFSATHYVWPNQYTQNLTSFASNITYRAWGGRKSMTYGNTTSEQFTYNARLQPASYTLNNMNYQNTNICCSYPTYSTMTWTFGYYDDGSVKHAWDSTNDWFDRAFKYDHAGRLKEASTFRRARGLSPYPAINYPDPYYQNITYDTFNHSSRTGKLYTGEPSDVGTYANNRRMGWQYDADGNTTGDASYEHTFDAAGKVKRSVSHAMVGDGIQYPQQPRLDITQTYDGDGAPAKREQISRQRGLIVEGEETEPIEDFKTTHYLRSSVLGGATVVELGWGTPVHIYADGQRIAREYGGSVTFEHHNPVNGSWVTSHGHSSYRTTSREERDPRGAETPLSNPYAYAQSYVDWKFSEPLFIEGSDPFDYSGGCTLAGMPISCGDAARFIGRGLGQVNRIAVSQTNPRAPQVSQGDSITVEETLIQITHVRVTAEGQGGGQGKLTYYRGTRTRVVNVPRAQQPQNPAQPIDPRNVPHRRLTDVEMRYLRHFFYGITDQEDCAKFLEEFLAKAAELNPSNRLVSDDIQSMFESVASGGGFFSAPGASYNTVGGDITNNTGAIYFSNDPRFYSYGPVNRGAELAFLSGTFHGMAQTAIHELLHHAGFGDRALANTAAFYRGEKVSFANTWEGTLAASTYWNNTLNEHCH